MLCEKAEKFVMDKFLTLTRQMSSILTFSFDIYIF
jgi:hypothetical protein